MNILFVSSEMSPLAKTGGLADVVGALSKTLRAKGEDVRVIMPLYRCIKERFQGRLRFLFSRHCKMNWRQAYVGLFSMEVEGVPVYFIDNEQYFGYDQLYVNYDFDIERFAFFERAVLDLLATDLPFHPQILALHDWQCGMIPMLLRVHYQSRGYLQDVATVLTIHNLKYQGVHGLDQYRDFFDLPVDVMREDTCLQSGSPNALKAGIIYADGLTTVSPSYAQEILTDEYGEGLAAVLRDVQTKLTGILNGLDIEAYNPQSDPFLWKNYDVASRRSGKAKNKRRLLRELHLADDQQRPLLVMITRLTEQKGIDLLFAKLDEFLALDLNFVIMGTGDPNYEQQLAAAAGRHAQNMRALIQFDEEMARKLYAAGDLFLMPSLFEPCGLSQMIAMRYGCLPLVRETGGLKDTVEPYNRFTGAGTGFSFTQPTASDFLATIFRACDLFRHDPRAWQVMVRRGMVQDFSWTVSAQRYRELYQKVWATKSS